MRTKFLLSFLGLGLMSCATAPRPSSSFAPESAENRCRTSKAARSARFGIWELRFSECDDGQRTQIEVWDRRLQLEQDLTDLERQRLSAARAAMAKAQAEKRPVEGETFEEIFNDPMFRRQSLVLPIPVKEQLVIGLNSDACRDEAGRQVVILIPLEKNKRARWADVAPNTHRLENPEIVFSRWWIDESVGRFHEDRQPGRFTCTVEP